MPTVIAEQKLQTDYKAGTINPGSCNGFDRLPHLTAVQAYYMQRAHSSRGTAASSYNLFIAMLSLAGPDKPRSGLFVVVYYNSAVACAAFDQQQNLNPLANK